MIRKMLIVFCLAMLLACTQKVNLVDSFGRPVPDPSYRTSDISGTGLSSIFYFVKYEKKKDMDGSSILTPSYLEWRKKHIFKVGDEVEIFIEMYNTKEIEYLVYDRIAVDVKIGQFTDSSMRTNRNSMSNQSYRQYRFIIPTGMKAENVMYMVDITNPEGGMLFHIGPFKYSIED